MKTTSRQKTGGRQKTVASSGKSSTNEKDGGMVTESSEASYSPPKSSNSFTKNPPYSGTVKTDDSDHDVTDREDVKNDAGGHTSDSDFIIETDNDSDTDSSLLKVGGNICHTNSTQHLASASNMETMKKSSQKIKRRNGKKYTRVIKKARISLPKSRKARKLRMKEPEPKTDTSDMDWESLSEVEILGGSDENSGKEDTAVDGPLIVDTDESDEEAERSQIPLQEQLEKTIADGSAKNNLSVSNVKSIIWTVLTHDLVKEMLKTRLKGCDDQEAANDVMEPKLTRSKMKEVLEKGNDARCWPVSPVKLGQPPAGPSILDVEFAEEEDEEDDEYQPSKDAVDLESDDESIMSSHVSDIGSPFPLNSPLPRAPTTPRISVPPSPSTPVSKSADLQTSAHANTSQLLDPKTTQPENTVKTMGPPAVLPPLTHSVKQRLMFTSPEKQNKESEEDGIARRTRSKLPLTTTSLYDIEEAFVAPDITPDMYDTMCDDTDWQEFLKSLHKQRDGDVHNESVEQGEEDDPEFNYTAEAEETEPEEDRFDGPVRVSRRELQGLLEELEDLFNENDYSMIGLRTNLASAHQNAALLAKKPSGPSDLIEDLLAHPHTENQESDEQGTEGEEEVAATVEPLPEIPSVMDLAESYPMVLDHQLKLIEEHMRKHVQLMTQMYVLAQASNGYCSTVDTCKQLLVELDRFRNVSAVGPQSAFNACNLSGALEIVNREVDWAFHRQQRVPGAGKDTANQPSASMSVASDSVAALPEGSGERVTENRARRKRDLRADRKMSTEKRKGHVDPEVYTDIAHAQPTLLTIQKEIMWTSPVFLYPSYLPPKGLVPKHMAHMGRTGFCKGEDALLVLGKQQFQQMKGKGKGAGVYKMIHEYLMPCKSEKQLLHHFRDRAARRLGGILTQYKLTGELPKGAETAEEFSVEMVRAPCDQPEDVLPAWCKVYRKQRHSAELRQAKELLSKFKKEARQKKMAEKRRLKELAVEKRRQQEELSRQRVIMTPSDSTAGRMENEQNGRDSSLEPPAKVARVDAGVEQPVGAQASSQPVTVVPSVASAVCSQPSTLVTSQGLYVSLDLADLAKVRKALPKSHVIVLGESGEQRVVLMDQYLKSKPELADGDLHQVLSSLSDLFNKPSADSRQTHGPSAHVDQRGEPCDVNSDHSNETEKGEESTCGVDDSKAQVLCEFPLHMNEEAEGTNHIACTCTEKKNTVFDNSNRRWSDISHSDSKDSVREGKAAEDCSDNQMRHSKKEDSDRAVCDCGEKGTMAPSHCVEDESALLMCKEEMLCEQWAQDSVSPSDESVGEEDSLREHTGSGSESDRSWRGDPTKTAWDCDRSKTGILEQNNTHRIDSQIQTVDCKDFSKDATSETDDFNLNLPKDANPLIKSCMYPESVNDHNTFLDDPESDNSNKHLGGSGSVRDQNAVDELVGEQSNFGTEEIRSVEAQSRGGSPGRSETSEEQYSEDRKNRNMQHNLPVTADCSARASAHIGLIYYFHVHSEYDETAQHILQIPDSGKYYPPEKLPQDRNCLKQLNIFEHDKKKALGLIAESALYDKCMMQEDTELLKISSSSLSPISKLIKAGIIVNIVVNMMYSADYTQAQNSEDTAESPSSTTPDAKEGENSQQQETSSQRETVEVMEASDDGVSTTSDWGNLRSSQNSAQMMLSSASTSQGERDMQRVAASPNVRVDSSYIPGLVSVNLESHAGPTSEEGPSVLPEVPSTSSAGCLPSLAAGYNQRADDEEINNVSSSSLIRPAGEDSMHCELVPGSEVSSSGRSQQGDDYIRFNDDDVSMQIASHLQADSCETPYVETMFVQTGHSPLAQTAQSESSDPISSTVAISGPCSLNTVAISTSVVRTYGEKNVSWSNVSSVVSSSAIGDVEMSAQASGITQDSVSRQTCNSGFNVSTSERREGESCISEKPNTFTGGNTESQGKESVMFSRGSVASDQDVPADVNPQHGGTGHGYTAAGVSAVSSSDLSSVVVKDGALQLHSPSKEQASSICEKLPSTTDIPHSLENIEQHDSESFGVETSTLAQAADHVDLKIDSSKDEKNRQMLLQLIESGRHTVKAVVADFFQARALNWGGNVTEPSHRTSETATSSALCEADRTAQVTAKTNKEGSPLRELSFLQSVNERSPPPPDMLCVDGENSPAVATSTCQQASQMSASSNCRLSSTVSSGDTETPRMLSCLGLVSTKGADAAKVQASVAQVVSDIDSTFPDGGSQVIATLTPMYNAPPTSSPSGYVLHCPGDKRPDRSPSGSLRTLAPKPGPLTYPSPPRVARFGRSPKKQQLQKRVRAILPKGYSYELKMNSPTEAAARTLKRKATLFCQRSPSKPLLPKDPSMMQSTGRHHSTTLHSTTSSLLSWNRNGRGVRRSRRKVKTKGGAVPAVSVVTKKAPSHPKRQEERSQEESDETGSEVEDVAIMSQDDSQNEEEAGEAEDDQTYMHDLMAASTTIGFNPYIKTTADKDGHCSKQEIRRQQKLSLLAADVLETDPRKDDRDLAHAQSYLNKVKVAMQKDLPTYMQFMDTLRQFETSQNSPIEVYESVRGLLKNYPELLEDFAGFLQPAQALQTRCHMANQLIHHMRAFLRKLELHYGPKRARYAKILRTVGKWDFKTKSPAFLREMLLPLLGTLPPHLHDDFAHFFPDGIPAESHMESKDFEEIKLRDSDDDGNRSPDDFEDITFPDENDPYRTRRCPCVCHKASFTRRKKKEKYTHCYNCCLKVVNGHLYFQPSNVTTRRPVSATFYDPVPMPVPTDLPPPAHSRGTFHRSAVLDDADDDDMEDDMELEEDDAHVDTEDDKGTEDEKVETEEDDEKPETEDDEDEDDDDEEDVEEDDDDEELLEIDGNCIPAKRPRRDSVEKVSSPLSVPLSSKETKQLPCVEPVVQQSPSQQVLLQQPVEQQSAVQQPLDQRLSEQHSIAQQSIAQHPSAQHLHAPHSVVQQSLAQHLVAQQSVTQHAATQQSLVQHPVAAHFLAQHPVGRQAVIPQPQGPGREEAGRPASPSQQTPSVTTLPAVARLHHRKIGLPKPGDSNIRMRKRILSMRPGRQVSASMQSLAPKPGLSQEAESTSDLQSVSSSPGLGTTISPLLLPPSGAGGAWKTSRILSNMATGTVSVRGPDNTVIMFNSSLPNPALGDTLPSLHEKTAFFPLPANPPAGIGEARRGSVSTSESGSPGEKASLPTITSPHKNMQRGSFAGLLQSTQPAESDLPSEPSVSQEPSSVGDVSKETAPSSAPAAPLMSEDTLSALFEQMREGQMVDSSSISFDVTSNSSMSAMFSKMMQTPERGQEGAGIPSTSWHPLDLSTPHPPPVSSTTHPSPVPHQEGASQDSVEWTSEQDRLIVEMVRDHGASPHTCRLIANRLQAVTSAQVSERMSTLMEFLEVPKEGAAEEEDI